MKKLITILIAVSFTASVFGQAPQKISYQAVIRDAGSILITSTVVGMQISILQGSQTGTLVYLETQTPTTNVNGLVSIEIGGGIGFDTINWSNGPYFIKTETDPAGSTNYTISGTSQLLSVPYALHAKTAENISGTITENDPVYGSSVASGISGTDITNWNNKIDVEVDGSVTNELQALSLSNDTIYLSNGGFVKLPAGFNGDYNSLTNTPTNVSSFTNDAGYLTTFTEVDGSVTNELQALSISNDTVYLSNGGFVKLPAGFDGQYSSLTGTPTDVSSFTNDAGYLTTFTEVDGSVTNELQALTISNDTVYLTNGGFVKLLAGFNGQYSSLTGAPTNVSSFTNDAGYLTTFTEVDGSVTNELQALSLSNDTVYLSDGGFVKLPAGFDGQYSSLTGAPTNLSSFTNDAGYLTSYTETDPLWSLSPSFGITNTNITNWNNAYGWGNHALAGYLTSFNEIDPKIGINTSGYSPKWNGSALVTGAIYQDVSGNVGIGTTIPGSELSVVGNMSNTGNILSQGTQDFQGGSTLIRNLSGKQITIGQSGSNDYMQIEGGGVLEFNHLGISPVTWFFNDGNVGIGTITTFAKLHIKGSSDNTQFIIQANATQSNSNPLIKLQNSAGADLMWINSDSPNNTFIGLNAGRVNNLGAINNTFIGSNAGYSNTTGNYNTANGESALYSNTTGTGNTANGYVALQANNTGSYNTANGFQSLVSNTIGVDNTAIGHDALYFNTSGNKNTAIGVFAGNNNVSGSYNVFIGHQAGFNELGSNKLYIANSSANPALIYGDFSTGNVGIGTNSPNARLDLGLGYGASGEKFLIYNDDFSGPLAGTKTGFYLDRFALQNNVTFVFPTAPAFPGSYMIAKKNTASTTLVSLMTILGESGNVGIGTTTPTSLLHVKGTADPLQIMIENTGGNFKTGYGIKTALQEWFVGQQSLASTGFRIVDVTNLNTVRLQIETTTGNVGIGTTAPGQKLDVQGGNINTSGSLMTGGTARLDASGNLINIGNITAPGASTYTSGAGLTLALQGGNSGTVMGGAVTLTAGTSGTNIAGNNVELYGAPGGFNGTGGKVKLTGGTGGQSGGSGAFITVNGGGPNFGPGGNLILSSGLESPGNWWDVGHNGAVILAINGTEYMRIDGDRDGFQGYVGIGTSTPQRVLHVNDVMRLEPRATAPASPSKGDIYFDSTDNILKVYDGTIWRSCW